MLLSLIRFLADGVVYYELDKLYSNSAAVTPCIGNTKGRIGEGKKKKCRVSKGDV